MVIATKRKSSLERLTLDKYFTLIEHAADGIAILQDGVFKLVNTALARISGYDKEELPGMPFTKLLTPESQKLTAARYQARLAGKKVPPIYEVKAVTKDGEVRDIEINAALTEYEGRVADEVIIRDITERKRAEEQLRESEDKLKTYLESAPDGVYINDLKGTFLYGNKKAEEIIGYRKEELIGKSFLKLNLLPAKYLAKAGKLLALNAMRRPTGPDELELIRKDGSRVWVEINTTPIKQREKVVVIGFVRDITERKRMEQQLQEKNEQLDAQNEELRAINEELRATEEELQQNQEKLERMFESVTEGIVVANLDGTILKVNEKAVQMHGFASDDELLGKKTFELVAPGDRERKANNVREALKEGLVRSQEYTLLRADGSEFPGELSTSELKDASGNVIGYITIARDITERRQAEEKERQLQQELDLTSRLASIGQLAAGVAHEINNPLTGVIGFSHLLMSRDIPDDMKQDLQVINSEAQRVAKIVENLLTFARQRKPGREYVDINSIIARVLELRAYEMKVNNIEVEIQLAPDLPYTMADAGQLQQVFLNIVLNAEHFMTRAHNRGKLLVKTEIIDDNIRASFTDNGPGISKENLNKIFNPFFTTKEVGSGIGLGLSICHGIITQHKGKIYAQSELGQGATFIVELPIVDDSAQEGQAEVTKEEPQKPRGAKILVVDDEPAILTLLHRLLTEWGHSVETINNANSALDRLKTERYSLILLDIKMPGMSGVELYRHIEAIAPALTRRVMFITGDVMETATRDFLDRTRAPHITKPLNIEILKKTINHALNQTQVAATTSW
jgi:PAS domain S-box-containing protein